MYENAPRGMYSERNASLFNSEHSVIKKLPPDVAREFISLDPEAQKELPPALRRDG